MTRFHTHRGWLVALAALFVTGCASSPTSQLNLFAKRTPKPAAETQDELQPGRQLDKPWLKDTHVTPANFISSSAVEAKKNCATSGG